MKKNLLLIFTIFFLFGFSKQEKNKVTANPPIYIAFLWHMHQPIYWPYESIIQTQQNNRYPYSVFDIHNERTGPYTSWPKNAVQKLIDANLSHGGSQVSFSGSLIENLNNLEAFGNVNFQNWKSHWNYIKQQTTSLGNPRLDMVAFGYHHPLMGLIDYTDIRKQIQSHKQFFSQNFSGNYSKGIFPPENAFSNRIIPSLIDEGIQWVLVDNIHFDRTCEGYPFSTVGNMYEPNKSDVINPNPNDWVQLNGLWAPTKNSARWGRQPHYVEYIDPSTGNKTKIIAVPCDRYLGNEDGRGGFGALNYENVMSQLESFNTDPLHPILIVLHHDGDNYGGGSESYYNNNFQNFVNWLKVNPNRFVSTTIQDYLQMFPPDVNDIIHVEDGSWSGADNGDPEFKKWLGDPYNNYSPDRNSWGVITAAKNFVQTAEQISPNSTNTNNAWKYFLNGEASDYWYWDGSMNGIWDSHPARAANLSLQFSSQVIGQDLTPPTIFIPQREPYNPGGTEWGINQTNKLQVWSYVFDKSGLKSVKLKYRIDNDGMNPMSSIQNETYAGGNEVGAWNEIEMTGVLIPSQTNPQPLYKAKEYSASLDTMKNKLLDYYIEAIDSLNNTAKSPIRHVWIGSGSGSGGGTSGVSWSPTSVTKNDTITITVSNVSQSAKLHWGVNNVGNQWQTPDSSYWIPGTVKFNGVGPAVESPMVGPDSSGKLKIKIGPFNLPVQQVQRIAFVIHFNDNTWNNNNGQDFHIAIGSGSGGNVFVMDGQVDEGTKKAAANNNTDLYLGWNGTELYVASQSAQSQNKDVFIFVTDSLRTMKNAPWAKNGMVVGWSAYLANESTNNYVSWFDNIGVTGKAAGNFLEGTINIAGEFGYVPAKLFIAVGLYQTQDGGVLQNQVPVGNGNGNIEANEFYVFDYVVSNLNEKKFIVDKYNLSQNYPNPFNPETNIHFSLANKNYVKLRVLDILGNEIKTLVNEEREAGSYKIKFDGQNLASGIYFYQLQAGNYFETKKMLLIR